MAYEWEVADMLAARILVPCDIPKDWNTKAFHVIKANVVDVRLVGDFRGLNTVIKKLLWHTESPNQLLRHIPP